MLEESMILVSFGLTTKKNHGLLGNDVLNINSTKLINEIKIEKTGKLKNYKARLKFKENVNPC